MLPLAAVTMGMILFGLILHFVASSRRRLGGFFPRDVIRDRIAATLKRSVKVTTASTYIG